MHAGGHLAQLEAESAHVDGHVVTGGLQPTVRTGLAELERVDVVRQTPVGVVQIALHLELLNARDGLASGSLASEQLVGAFFWPVVQTRHQSNE